MPWLIEPQKQMINIVLEILMMKPIVSDEQVLIVVVC